MIHSSDEIVFAVLSKYEAKKQWDKNMRLMFE